MIITTDKIKKNLLMALTVYICLNDDYLNTCNSFQSTQGHKKVNFEDYKIFEVRIVRQTVMFQQMKTGR